MSGLRQGVASIVVACAVVGPSPQSITSTSMALGVLDRSREALGFEARGSLTSLRLVGTSTRVLGGLRFGSTVDLRLALPDRYLRVDVLALQAAPPGALSGPRGETATGFNGDRPIQRAAGPADLLRRELRLMLLGFFADSFDSSPVTAEHVGVAEAPDGRADGVALAFADGSAATLFIDTTTHLPRMVTWDGPDLVSAARAAGRSSSAGRSSVAEADVRAHLDTLVAHRWYFADYRLVGRFRWPFVLRHAVGSTVVEELRVDEMTVNPVFEAGLFDQVR